MISDKRKKDSTHASIMKELEKKVGKETTKNPHFQSFVSALVKNEVNYGKN